MIIDPAIPNHRIKDIELNTQNIHLQARYAFVEPKFSFEEEVQIIECLHKEKSKLKKIFLINRLYTKGK